jgi:hypothetical protein
MYTCDGTYVPKLNASGAPVVWSADFLGPPGAPATILKTVFWANFAEISDDCGKWSLIKVTNCRPTGTPGMMPPAACGADGADCAVDADCCNICSEYNVCESCRGG